MSRTNLKRYLMLLAAIGLIAVAANGSGTFASFDAQVTNAGNTIQTGSLYLHQTQNNVSLCKSESDTANNQFTGCTVVFNDPNVVLGPEYAKVEINDAGSLPASNIMFSVANCSVTVGSHGLVTFGSAPGCGDLFITIQETSGIGGSNLYCALGTDSSGTCAAPSTAVNLASTWPVALKTTSAATAGLTAGQTRDYLITISPDSSLTPSNVWQNRDVSFDLNWQINQ
jgi:hypothetical protein